ncbi:MAG: HAMP domain-containing histidine kinase [Rhodospirillales bacterium]|nr:HAMP domain-containing histidine kinase [Rhodospirillales bacterium]
MAQSDAQAPVDKGVYQELFELITTNNTENALVVKVLLLVLIILLPLLLYIYKMNRSNSQLKKSHAEQRRMLNTFAHEYRTPVAIINAGIDFLEKQDMGNGSNNHLEFSMMRRAVHRLVSLVDNSLRNERISAYVEKHTYEDYCDLVEVLISTRDAYTLINPDRIELNLGLVRALNVKIPNYELTTCVENLVENSLKFSGEKPILVTLKKEGDFAHVTISDQGIGIPEGELTKIFDKYHRGPNAETTVGIGLGLYLTKTIIDQSGGQISVESRENEYTHFHCKLPLVGKYD